MKMKSFSTLASAKAAIKKQGIAGVPHTVESRISIQDGTRKLIWVPVFKPELAEDRVELRSRGWDVE